ncbi:hypothetical protein [Bradyrhizobium sp. JR3.5]
MKVNSKSGFFFGPLDPPILAGPHNQFDVLRTLHEQFVKVAFAVRYHRDAGRRSQYLTRPFAALDPSLRFLSRRRPLAPWCQLLSVTVPNLHRDQTEQPLRLGLYRQCHMQQQTRGIAFGDRSVALSRPPAAQDQFRRVLCDNNMPTSRSLPGEVSGMP